MAEILALDPGPEKTAWVRYDSTQRRVRDHEITPNADLLRKLRETSTVGTHVAVEMIASYGMAVGREVFETCVWIGVFLEALHLDFAPGVIVYRREVKLHLCGSPKAKDANVRTALMDKFGPGKLAVGTKKFPGPLYGITKDRWAALAVAVTFAETRMGVES